MKLRREAIIATLILITALGFALRLRGLGKAGFNEDEIHKVEAARAYLHGDLAHNLEHPMLMKSLVAVSLATTDRWNKGLGRSHQVSEEVAVRLPNVLFGSLTAVVLFLIAQELFGLEVGLLAAFLWSIGTIAIMDNRIAKEDTLLVCFTWLAYYFYWRAKKAAESDVPKSEKLYAASGASFGLMLASKYFPHYLGLNFLYYCLVRNKRKYPVLRWRDLGLFLGFCGIVFLAANPVVLFPSTLKYILGYAGGSNVTHHGYLMMGQLRYEDLAHFRGGMPVYFYPLFLAIKTPIPVLAAFAVGAVEVFRRRNEPGHSFILCMFLLWILPFSLLGTKWLRWMLSWMPAVYIIAAIGILKCISWASKVFTQELNRRIARPLTATLALLLLAVPAWIAATSGPYYTLYLNPLGLGRTGYYFPQDELNDIGLREAIAGVCEQAPKHGSVGGETTALFSYYLHKCGRDDLQYFDLSDRAGRAAAPPDAYIVVQNGRKHAENIAFLQKVEYYQTPIETIQIHGAAAVRVYRDTEFAELRRGQ